MNYLKSKYYIVWSPTAEVIGPYNLVKDAQAVLERKTIGTWKHPIVKGVHVPGIVTLMQRENRLK